jgi:hypothetical protein
MKAFFLASSFAVASAVGIPAHAMSDEAIARKLAPADALHKGLKDGCTAARLGALRDPRVAAACGGRFVGEQACKVGKACERLGNRIYESMKRH